MRKSRWGKISQTKVGFCEGPVGVGCCPLKTMLQDGSLLECLKNVVEDPLGKDLVARLEKRVSLEVKLFDWPMGEEVLFDDLFSKFTFSSLVGMPIYGFEKESFSLLRKIEKRRGFGACVSGGTRKLNLTSHFEREILKLECLVNYKSSPLLIRGRERSNGATNLVV